MGLLKRKKKETKTFIDGQMQEDTRKDNLPEVPEVPENVKQNVVPKPEEPHIPHTIKLVKGFYYWLDDVGELCCKVKRD